MVLLNYIVRLKQVTDIKDLQKEIMNNLNKYSKILAEDVQKAQKETVSTLKDQVKTDSPKRLGDYETGWRIKKEDKKLILYNKTDYQLTHLLEYGHAKKNGGRVAAQVHIRPAEQTAVTSYLQKIEQAIKQ
jgi:hypothetical protein